MDNFRNILGRILSLPQQVQAISQIRPQQPKPVTPFTSPGKNTTLPNWAQAPAKAVTTLKNNYLQSPIRQQVISNLDKAAVNNPTIKAMSNPTFMQTPQGQQAIQRMAIGAAIGGTGGWGPKPPNTALGGSINSNAKFQAAMAQNKSNLLRNFGGSGDKIEVATGFAPGAKSAFDYALLTKDATMVRRLLDQVPTDYKIKMFRQIASVLKSVPQLVL